MFQRFSLSRLPDIKPSFSKPQKASTSGQVILDVNLGSLRIQSSNVMAKRGCRAQTSAAALVKEFSDSLSLSHSLHSQAIQKHMPVKYRNLWKMYYHMCALKTWEKELGRKQDRQGKPRVSPCQVLELYDQEGVGP